MYVWIQMYGFRFSYIFFLAVSNRKLFFLAANREVQLNNQFYKTTRELRTLFKNILERRRLRSANSLKKTNIGEAPATRELGKTNPSAANTCEPRAQAEFF